MQRRDCSGGIQVVGQRINHGFGRLRGLDPVNHAAPLAQRRLRLAHLLFRPVHRRAVMRGQQHKADHLARDALIQQILDRKEIAQRFGHFPPLDLHHLVVHPEAREIPVRIGAAALRDLVFVVRKLQIQPAAVNVEALAQQVQRHGGTLDMPAGPAIAPRRFPAGLVAARRFPQHKIHRIVFVVCHLDPLAGAHVFQLATRQRAVFGIGIDVEQHMPLCRVGMALFDQHLNHRDHLGDIFGRARLERRAQRPQRVHVVMIPRDGFIGDVADIAATRSRLCIYLVIDIGKVSHIGDLAIIHMFEQPVEHIEHHHGAGIADVRPVIDRRAAHIHAQVFAVDRLENLLAAGSGVVKSDLGHGCSSRKFPAAGLAF